MENKQPITKSRFRPFMRGVPKDAPNTPKHLRQRPNNSFISYPSPFLCPNSNMSTRRRQKQAVPSPLNPACIDFQPGRTQHPLWGGASAQLPQSPAATPAPEPLFRSGSAARQGSVPRTPALRPVLHYVQNYTEYQAQIQAEIEAQVQAQIASQMKAQVQAGMEAQVRSHIKLQIRAHVQAQISASASGLNTAHLYLYTIPPPSSGFPIPALSFEVENEVVYCRFPRGRQPLPVVPYVSPHRYGPPPHNERPVTIPPGFELFIANKLEKEQESCSREQKSTTEGKKKEHKAQEYGEKEKGGEQSKEKASAKGKQREAATVQRGPPSNAPTEPAAMRMGHKRSLIQISEGSSRTTPHRAADVTKTTGATEKHEHIIPVISISECSSSDQSTQDTQPCGQGLLAPVGISSDGKAERQQGLPTCKRVLPAWAASQQIDIGRAQECENKRRMRHSRSDNDVARRKANNKTDQELLSDVESENVAPAVPNDKARTHASERKYFKANGTNSSNFEPLYLPTLADIDQTVKDATKDRGTPRENVVDQPQPVLMEGKKSTDGLSPIFGEDLCWNEVDLDSIPQESHIAWPTQAELVGRGPHRHSLGEDRSWPVPRQNRVADRFDPTQAVYDDDGRLEVQYRQIRLDRIDLTYNTDGSAVGRSPHQDDGEEIEEAELSGPLMGLIQDIDDFKPFGKAMMGRMKN